MGGYVTNTRAITSKADGPTVYRAQGVTYTGAKYHALSGIGETTTSFRSGRSEKLGTSKDDPLAFNPQSYKEAFKIYKTQYEESKRTDPIDVPPGYHPDTFVDTGHTFNSVKRYLTGFSHPFGFYGKPTGNNYQGPLMPDSITSSSFDATLPSTAWYEARAIERTIPTNPIANLATFLGELKADVPPAMIGLAMRNATSIFRGLGGEYLNVEFGWKPFISDLRDILHAVTRAHKLVLQYERDSGKIVRRKYTFPPLDLGTVTTRGRSSQPPDVGPSAYWQASVSSPNIFQFSGPTTGSISTTVHQTTWFSGAYSYFLQRGNSHLDKMKRFEQKVNHLFGLRLTPDVLWELAPWSWLADWNSNIGDNLTNASLLTSDGLIIRYGYLMTTREVRAVHTIPSLLHFGGQTGPISVTCTTIVKDRKKAMPYGFGSNPASYTSRQWSILAALGMTKTPNSLR